MSKTTESKQLRATKGAQSKSNWSEKNLGLLGGWGADGGRFEQRSRAVQRLADAVLRRVEQQKIGVEPPPSDVHQAAQAGVSGPGGALPHLETIQRSFGHHDISGVRAHVGGTAAQASKAMGAEAYATGNDVAFKSAPSLHTAAHEAAHVVQQRSGKVQLKGGVGQVGDIYEQHADAVADLVVQGKNATPLLDTFAPSVTGPAAIQNKAIQMEPESEKKPKEKQEAAGWAPHPQSAFSVRLFGFKQGKAELQPVHKEKLHEINDKVRQKFEAMYGRPESMMTQVNGLLGYASMEGDEKFNDKLSQQRAEQTWEYIKSICMGLVMYDDGPDLSNPTPPGGVSGLGPVDIFGEDPVANRAVEVLVVDPVEDLAVMEGMSVDKASIAGHWEGDGEGKGKEARHKTKATDRVGRPVGDRVLGPGVTDAVGGLSDLAGGFEAAGEIAQVGDAVRAAGPILSAVGLVAGVISAIIHWESALKSGEIAEECVGAAYGVAYWAHDLSGPPSLPDDYAFRDAFAAGFRKAYNGLKTNNSQELAEYKEQLRQASAQVVIKTVYQELAKGRLEESYLFVIKTEGVAYNMAKRRYLTWPKPEHR